MTERPIIFSAPMVRAILDGSKTQTRRVVKPRPYVHDSAILLTEMNGRGYYATSATRYKAVPFAVGDVLWVREPYHLDGPRVQHEDAMQGFPSVFYRATEEADAGFKWRPSIHMPSWASRIDLEVIAVRVERLQSISEEDARAEGVVKIDSGSTVHERSARDRFESLWESIHGPESWAANPWVWAVWFRRVRP